MNNEDKIKELEAEVARLREEKSLLVRKLIVEQDAREASNRNADILWVDFHRLEAEHDHLKREFKALQKRHIENLRDLLKKETGELNAMG